jgi:hypothetical protein
MCSAGGATSTALLVAAGRQADRSVEPGAHEASTGVAEKGAKMKRIVGQRCPSNYVGSTSGVPQTAADLSRSAQLGSLGPLADTIDLGSLFV